MIRSLRSRHLINGLIVIIIGILVLGALLSLSIYQSKTEAIAEEIERTALDLLGFIEYDNGTFKIMEPNRAESDAFIDERKLRTNGKERFAYLWDKEQQKIIWDSLDNDAVDQQAVNNHFVLFDFNNLFKSTETQGKGFSPAYARKVHSVPVTDGEQPTQYMVATQRFTLNLDSGKKDYLFIVATSVADIEADIYELIKILVMLLIITAVLLLIAQLIFSQWVTAPIKQFEQEVVDIVSGKKKAFANEYPKELESIKDSINELINSRER